MKDPYGVVSCAHCEHKMISDRYRNVIYPNNSTPEEKIHARIDEALPSPHTYGCTCGHFTIIGKQTHLERYLESF